MHLFLKMVHLEAARLLGQGLLLEVLRLHMAYVFFVKQAVSPTVAGFSPFTFRGRTVGAGFGGLQLVRDKQSNEMFRLRGVVVQLEPPRLEALSTTNTCSNPVSLPASLDGQTLRDIFTLPSLTFVRDSSKAKGSNFPQECSPSHI